MQNQFSNTKMESWLLKESSRERNTKHRKEIKQEKAPRPDRITNAALNNLPQQEFKLIAEKAKSMLKADIPYLYKCMYQLLECKIWK